MATRSNQPPPEDYKLSRAAMRDRYGSRAIDARAPQSAKDYTPSGRQVYLEQESARRGITPAEVNAPNQRAVQAKEEVGNAFKRNFARQQIVDGPAPVQAPMLTRQSRRQPFQGGLASPEDVGLLRQQGAAGTVRTPFGTVTLGLLPETGPAEEMTSFLPTASPLTGFGLPSRSSFMGSPIPKRFNRYG